MINNKKNKKCLFDSKHTKHNQNILKFNSEMIFIYYLTVSCTKK